MVFSDLFFLYAFIPAFIVCYLIGACLDRYVLAGTHSSWIDEREHPNDIRPDKYTFKNIVLVIFSLLFYAWGEPVYVFLMLISVMINYAMGRIIDGSEAHRRLALVIGLVCNLAILGTFKYAGFFAEQLNALGLACPVPKISLPIGISFYTFQSISYLIDVYRRESTAQKRYVDLLLYISMFPQLIAGPIVRYSTVANEINHRHVSSSDLADGIFRFTVDLGKKVIIANQLSEISDQFLVNGLQHLTTSGAWIGIVAFTLQIYFDFSGYSDMAIGIGRCLGFHFNENFNHPYICNSITDFWRRWHMSLGSFFRDYVYIPLGGNRRHQWMNILIVWFLTGMWHGASWNFIIWGVYFGLIIWTEKFTLLRVKDSIPSMLLHLYSIIIVVIGWGIFYFDDFSKMVTFFTAAFGGAKELHNFVSQAAIMDNFWLWVAAILFCMPVRRKAAELTAKVCGAESTLTGTIFFVSRLLFSIAVIILSSALLVGATNNAFLYTRF